ncbi:MAG: chromosome segregation protein SMC [Candidatus Nanohaloarchaeota archaeon QJJ-9]|nr:chromosome segregation protein SMC [Candidatus Nanohaloarchaeota archaeon QJJ-9]
MEGKTRITKLTMKGFKSFQQKTAIPFYKGLTAIVGSNGSGKSNILDAISFVMGKRSSHLRAEKLEQLIFNGGDSRKPSDKAEVTLYLDNSSGIFDEFLDSHEDEVKIGRKVKRNGYATYRFQGTNCKRKKIDAILDKADINPDGYHFVRQGKVTSIVKMTPMERKKIIEDISGISYYEEKKEDAIEELEEVQERLNEFQIKKELKKNRLEQLRDDKEAAEEYKKLEEKKKDLKYSILRKRKETLEKEIKSLGEEEKEERIEELEEKVEELDERLEELEEEKEKVQDEIEKEEDTNIVKEIERLKGKIERKKGKVENKREKVSDIDSLLSDYEKMSSYSGRNRAVKKILNQDKNSVYGTVGQLLHYEKRYSAAIETALGGKIDNIVVENYQTATECVNYLKKNKIGRASFLPMDRISRRSKTKTEKKAVSKPGVIDYAINLVEFDSKYEKAINHVLGYTLVAEDLGSLKKAGRVRAVTLDGDILRKGGSVTGGKKKRSRSKKKKSSSINPEKKKKKKEQLEEEIEELKKEIGELNKMLEEKKQEQEDSSEVSEELKERKNEIQEEIDETREERKEKAEELNKLRSKIGDVQKKRAKFEAELDNVKEELEEFEEYSKEEVIDDKLSNLRRNRTRTINKMNDLGNVNMRAIEEYKEFKEEYDQFIEKIEEVEEEKQEIEEIIEDIESNKREKFTETMETVSENFNEIFNNLFNGGEANLELEEEDIDSGLLLKAHPPEKEPHVIDALSGGEKTLTAIAFLFALQEHDPSPFYVMDEIDAALDQKNSKRLSDLLKDYSEDYQFLFISHNEETVRHADRAYGASMRDGVSKIRSIELES